MDYGEDFTKIMGWFEKTKNAISNEQARCVLIQHQKLLEYAKKHKELRDYILRGVRNNWMN